MSTASELLQSGDYIEYRELCRRVARVFHMSNKTVAEWLRTPLSKIRSMLLDRGLMILPEGRSWACLYDADMVYLMAAYMQWHRFGKRRSVASVVTFFRSFIDGKPEALSYLPPEARKKFATSHRGSASLATVTILRPAEYVAS